jgi:hypothetical protein
MEGEDEVKLGAILRAMALRIFVYEKDLTFSEP